MVGNYFWTEFDLSKTEILYLLNVWSFLKHKEYFLMDYCVASYIVYGMWDSDDDQCKSSKRKMRLD